MRGDMSQRVMVDVKAPEMFKFERINDVITGILMGIESVMVQNKPQKQYIVKQDNGTLATFLQTYDMKGRLRDEFLGHYIEVRYLGEDKHVETQGNPLRRFGIKVSAQKEIDPQLGF
jgi:hypothetical protein